MIDKNGKEAIQYYLDIRYTGRDDGYISVEDPKHKWGLIDYTGNVIIPCIYDSYFEFQGNFAIVQKDKQMGIIDRAGNQILPNIYDQISRCVDSGMTITNFGSESFTKGEFYEKNLQIVKDEKCGYIDINGKQITSIIYDIIHSENIFDNDGCLVRKNGRYGYIDLSGKEIVPCQDNVGVSNFVDGFAYVWNANENLNNAWIVDKKGRTVVPASANIKVGQRFSFIINKGKIGYANSLPYDLEVTATKTSSAIYVDGKKVIDEQYDNLGEKTIISKEKAAQLRGYLETVVTGGTATATYMEGYHIAGKTGTANKVNTETGGYETNKYVASFAGMAPTDNPKVTLIVTVEEPSPDKYYAAETAVPAAKKLFTELFTILNIDPDSTAKTNAK
jgi:hypothetical protein